MHERFRIVRRLAPVVVAAGLGVLALGSGSPARLETLDSIGQASYDRALDRATRLKLEVAVAFAAESDRTRSLVVWHRGAPALEAHFHGQIAEAPQNVKSITKSLNSLIVGLAIDRGRIESLDDPVGRYLPESFAAARDPRAEGITIRHLLTMTSGLATIGYGTFQRRPDWTAAILDQRLLRPPGSAFQYDTPVTHLLSELVAASLEGDLTSFANRELLEPIGARIETWRRAPSGTEMGGNDAYLRAADLARLGELVRRGGVWKGRRVIPAAWLEASTADQIEPAVPAINHGTIKVTGYGYLWWRIEIGDASGYAALGHGGQYLVVLPERELVIAITSHWPGPSSSAHYRHLKELLVSHLLAAFPATEDVVTTAERFDS
jgi:CubicO group peptidase (beta-lactamase class C family)